MAKLLIPRRLLLAHVLTTCFYYSAIKCEIGHFGVLCSSGCTCNGNHMTCNGNIPTEVPSEVTAVTVYSVDYSVYSKVSPFDFISWQNVTHLEILPDVTSDGQLVIARSMTTLPFEAFHGLRNLTHLRYSSVQLREMATGALCGLQNLEVLDLGDNFELGLPILINGMKTCEFPNLHTLCIRGLSKLSSQRPSFESDFVNILARIPLRALDMSDIDGDFRLEHPEFVRLVQHLEYLNLQGRSDLSKSFVTFFVLQMMMGSVSFDNLTELNLNHVQAIQPDLLKFNIDFLPVLDFKMFPSHLQTLHLSNSISAESVANLQMFEDENINVTVAFQPSNATFAIIIPSVSSVQSLDLSRNNIGQLSLNISKESNLKFINISYNNLYLTKPEVLASSFNFPNLEKLIASYNGIKELAVDSFARTPKLQFIDLSYNKLTDFRVQLSPIQSLKVLDLSNNNILFLSDKAMNMLTLYFMTISRVNNSGITRITLAGNPIMCSCKTLKFMEWIVFIYNTVAFEVPICWNGRSNVTKATIDDIKEECKVYGKNVGMIVGFSLGGVLLVTLIVSGLFIIRYLTDMRRKLALIQRMKRYTAYVDRKTPVFLSFCSKDEEFVREYIIPNLNRRLQEALNTSRNCVSTGDYSFTLGKPVIEEMIRCIEESTVLVCCISRSYCASKWCREEVFIAHFESKPIILMFLEHVQLRLMPKILQKVYMSNVRSQWTRDNSGQVVLIPDWSDFIPAVSELIVSNTTM